MGLRARARALSRSLSGASGRRRERRVADGGGRGPAGAHVDVQQKVSVALGLVCVLVGVEVDDAGDSVFGRKVWVVVAGPCDLIRQYAGVVESETTGKVNGGSFIKYDFTSVLLGIKLG